MTEITLDYLAAVRVFGDDAASFLQAQLTADLAHLSPGDSCFAAYCHPKGNVIAVMHVTRESDGYLMIASRSLMDPLVAALGKYVLRARVTIETLEGSVLGTRSGKTMVYAFRPEGRDQAGTSSSVLGNWKAAELRAGTVWLNPETSGKFLPQMLGLDRLGAVSFKKGCYPGQEVIARVRYLGTVKRVPLIAVTETLLAAKAGEDVEIIGDEGVVGKATVIDAAPEDGGSVVFLVARTADGAAVRALQFGDERLEARELTGT